MFFGVSDFGTIFEGPGGAKSDDFRDGRHASSAVNNVQN